MKTRGHGDAETRRRGAGGIRPTHGAGILSPCLRVSPSPRLPLPCPATLSSCPIYPFVAWPEYSYLPVVVYSGQARQNIAGWARAGEEPGGGDAGTRRRGDAGTRRRGDGGTFQAIFGRDFAPAKAKTPTGPRSCARKKNAAKLGALRRSPTDNRAIDLTPQLSVGKRPPSSRKIGPDGIRTHGSTVRSIARFSIGCFRPLSHRPTIGSGFLDEAGLPIVSCQPSGPNFDQTVPWKSDVAI